MSILFFPVYYEGDFSKILEKAKKEILKLNKKKIKIFYVEPWEKLAEKLKEELKDLEIELIDFLGCEKHKANLDVVICDGEFHLRAIEGKFLWINPLFNEIKLIERRFKVDKRIYTALSLKNFGIIVSIKLGQFRLKVALKIKELLEKFGKNVYLFVGDEIKNLENFPFIEVWINTACPRLKDDYKKVLFFNWDEVLEALKSFQD